MTMSPPKFFTWIETKYEHPTDVPERLRTYMRVSWLDGAKVEELATTFKIPIEWVEVFVREEPRTTHH